jgi:EVE domain
MAIRCWLLVASREDARRAVAGGFVQAHPGLREALGALAEADRVLIYSPRVGVPESASLRAFTAAGRIAPGAPQRVEVPGERSAEWKPWRRRMQWDTDAGELYIRPYLASLDLTAGKLDWGYQLRAGLLEISRHDFEFVHAQMRLRAGSVALGSKPRRSLSAD